MAPGETKQRSGVVALIGRPNAGKSTLLNRLVGAKVTIVSDSPQTTRHRIRGVVTTEEGQAVFVDTPGVHKPLYAMNRRMMKVTRRTLHEVDLITLMVDASEPTGGGIRYLMSMIEPVLTPVILALNKVDRMPKPALLPIISRFADERQFAEIIPVSALRGDNSKALLEAVFRHLPIGPFLFPDDAITDRPIRFLVAELIREQLLHRIREELPYSTAVVIERWEDPERVGALTRIEATILVERDSQKPIVIGRQGSMLKQVGKAARLEIEQLVGGRVNLRLWVRVRSSWRQRHTVLDRLEIEV